MNNEPRSVALAGRLWLLTNCLTIALVVIWIPFVSDPFLIAIAFVSPVASLPAFFVLWFALPLIRRQHISIQAKKLRLAMLCLAIVTAYGMAAAATRLLTPFNNWGLLVGCVSALLICTLLALAACKQRLNNYFTSFIQTTPTMETVQQAADGYQRSTSSSNRILTKGLITGALILLMLIPTAFISSLVTERQTRQQQISAEVSSKWANAQTLSGPYLYLPYKSYSTNKEGKATETINELWILPENLSVHGNVEPQVRKRSIYSVLLYRAGLQHSGNFEFHLPREVSATQIQLADARICVNLSDFKGIEKQAAVHFNGATYELSPGLPGSQSNETGLSAPVTIAEADLSTKPAFSMDLQLKGSSQLHFMPLGNCEFELHSPWPNPSFDGNSLPTERNVSDSGFTAKWVFNKANLPFGTTLTSFKADPESLSFGLTMLEPADQYVQTNRSVKYAILFIGLTFCLFFIIELMQHKPLHPVQYALVGIALVVFYSLLLSISEFLLFNFAYLIAAVATISLITCYAYAHFKKLGSAAIFAGVLTLLYGFIFVLIQLEDTALLIGSIGLFIVLALVMFASRRINWYAEPASKEIAI